MSKPRIRQQAVIEDVEWIIGTDSPESIAVRLGYRRLNNLLTALRRWGRADLADRLSPNGAKGTITATKLGTGETSAWMVTQAELDRVKTEMQATA